MDFSILSDDQLLDLLKAAMAEALKRGGDIASAAKGEVLSAQERAAIEFQVAEKLRVEREEKERKRVAQEAESRMRYEELKKQSEKKIETTWEIKSAAIEAIRQWGYDGEFEINIWSRGADRRVYFQKDNAKRTSWKWCLYLGGNNYHPPGDFEGEGADCWFDDKQDELKALLKAIASSWKSDVSIPCKVGDVAPAPKILNKYLQAIGIGVKTNV